MRSEAGAADGIAASGEPVEKWRYRGGSRRLRWLNSKELTAGPGAGGCGHLPIRASLAKCDGGATKQAAIRLL